MSFIQGNPTQKYLAAVKEGSYDAPAAADPINAQHPIW